MRQLPTRLHLPIDSDILPNEVDEEPTSDLLSHPAIPDRIFLRDRSAGAFLLPRESSTLASDDGHSDWTDYPSVAGATSHNSGVTREDHGKLRRALGEDILLQREDRQQDSAYEAALRGTFNFPPMSDIDSEEEIEDRDLENVLSSPAVVPVVKSKAIIDSSDEEEEA